LTRRGALLIDVAAGAWALALGAGTLAKSALDVSSEWDVFYYHLPFAARLAGVVSEDVYAFTPANDARYAGFPLLVEALQGAAWRLVGRPEAANFVAWLAVLAFVFLLRRAFRVPVVTGALSLLGVPLVATHATACYADLLPNLAVASAVLLAADAVARGGAVAPTRVAAVAVACAVAVNGRFQCAPLAALAMLALAVQGTFGGMGGTRARTALALAAATPLVFATPLRNALVHGNPVWPVQLGGFPYVEEAYRQSPPWLAGVPQPVRFAASLLELGVRPLSDPRRWTVDQWMPDEATGNRMGGFFSFYVVAQLALLAWLARGRRGAAFAGAVLAVTLVIAPLPQSHELRYYLAWMLVLVGANLALAGPRVRVLTALGFAASLAVVLATRGAYVVPSGYGVARLVADKVEPRLLDAVRDGDRVCFRREPWTMLYAAPFHRGRRHAVREGDGPSDCGPGYRFLP